MLGFILGGILLFFICVAIIVGMLSGIGSKSAVSVKDNTILHLTFGMNIPDRTGNNPFKNLNTDGESSNPLGLNDILENIKKAGKDSHIKGILLEAETFGSGWAKAEEIRRALLDFRKQGKWVIAYAENYTKGAYYIATAADKIYLNPSGDLLLNGMYSEVHFVKNMLEKLGVEMQVIRHGKFKGAVEMFMLDKLSNENREQISVYVNSIWQHFVTGVAAGRKLEKTDIERIANDMIVRKAEDALEFKLVDGLWYKDQVLDDLRKRTGKGEKDKLNLMSIAKYSSTPGKAWPSGEDKIAIVYATGDIGPGNGGDDNIGSEGLSETLRKARLDDKIKAVVLRVNSPGGSALASEIIWREVELLRKAKKPVVVSMGDVAASGGYYIACGADSILAEPNTITGSIGVFGLIPNTQKLMHDKLGITSDGVKVGKYSDLGKLDRPLTADEKVIYQKYVDEIYDQFLTRVADGRRLNKAQVDSIAQGRVWTGADALHIGLVDRLGNLEDAVKVAACLAKLNKYGIKELPKQKDPFENLLKSLNGEADNYFARQQLGEYYKIYETIKSVGNMRGIQARMWYDVEVR